MKMASFRSAAARAKRFKQPDIVVVTPVHDLTKLIKDLVFMVASLVHLMQSCTGCCSHLAVFSTQILEAAGSLQTMGVLQVFIGEEELVLECSHSALTGSVCHHDSTKCDHDTAVIICMLMHAERLSGQYIPVALTLAHVLLVLVQQKTTSRLKRKVIQSCLVCGV